MATHPPKTSELLAALRDAFPQGEQISISQVLRQLDQRAFGLLLLILALPNCLPSIPGLPAIFGLLMLLPAVQMILGVGHVWLPKKIANIMISSDTLRRAIDLFLPYLTWLEKYVRPRLEFLTDRPFTIFYGIQVVILAIVLIPPIPFGHFAPAFSVAAMAIALLQRDGVLILVSFIFFLLSILVAYLSAGMMVHALDWLWGEFSKGIHILHLLLGR